MKCRLLLILVLVPALARPAPAGIIFGKKGKKPTPAERVPELLALVKTDGDENKRANAAQELRQYDPAAFPDIVPVLIDVLLNDKKPAVRAEAAQSLGRMRPVSQQAGLALEQALAKDPSMRVRLQARSSLLQYHWAGYRASKKEESPIIQSKEPPLADQEKGPPVINTTGQAPTPPPPAQERLKPQPAPAPPTSWSPSGPSPLAPGNPPPPVSAKPETKEPPPAPPVAPPAAPPVAPSAPPAPAGASGPDLTPPE